MDPLLLRIFVAVAVFGLIKEASTMYDIEKERCKETVQLPAFGILIAIRALHKKDAPKCIFLAAPPCAVLSLSPEK